MIFSHFAVYFERKEMGWYNSARAGLVVVVVVLGAGRAILVGLIPLQFSIAVRDVII